MVHDCASSCRASQLEALWCHWSVLCQIDLLQPVHAFITSHMLVKYQLAVEQKPEDHLKTWVLCVCTGTGITFVKN